MEEIPFIKWEPYKGYLNNHCPHWTVDGTFCCSCGEGTPFYLRDKNTGIIDKGMSFESNFTLDDDENGYGLNKKTYEEHQKDLNNRLVIKPELDKPNITLDLDSDSIDKYTPLTIILNGEKITLDHEDIKDLFYREKERKISKLVDFMRDNDFKEKDISGVISNLRSER